MKLQILGILQCFNIIGWTTGDIQHIKTLSFIPKRSLSEQVHEKTRRGTG